MLRWTVCFGLHRAGRTGRPSTCGGRLGSIGFTVVGPRRRRPVRLAASTAAPFFVGGVSAAARASVPSNQRSGSSVKLLQVSTLKITLRSPPMPLAHVAVVRKSRCSLSRRSRPRTIYPAPPSVAYRYPALGASRDSSTVPREHLTWRVVKPASHLKRGPCAV